MKLVLKIQASLSLIMIMAAALVSAAQAQAPKKPIEIIPSCLLADVVPMECRDISIFIKLLIELGRYLFTIIGAVALAAFVYGGFMFILSAGNPEKIKKGTDAMLAAVIGLIIAFGGYMIIRFLGEAIQVKPGFTLPKTQ